jgi:hypothetical protein
MLSEFFGQVNGIDRFLFICTFCAIVIILVAIVYRAIYWGIINKRVKSGKKDTKRIPDASRYLNGITSALLILTGILNLASINLRIGSRGVYEMYWKKHVHTDCLVADYSEKEGKYIASRSLASNSLSGEEGMYDFINAYSETENKGYTKEVVEDGPLRLTVFKKETNADTFLPDFICFAECDELEGVYSTIYFERSRVTGYKDTIHMTGDGYDGFVKRMYVGYLDKECEVEIEIGVMTQESCDKWSKECFDERVDEFSEAYIKKVIRLQ